MINQENVFPLRGKLYGEVVVRERISPGGIYIAESLKTQPITRVKVIKKGLPGLERIKKRWKEIDIDASQGDIIHIKRQMNPGSGVKQFEAVGEAAKQYIFVRFGDVIAIEKKDGIKALRDDIIVRVTYAEKVSEIIIPDSAKQYSGEFWGEVIAIGPEHKSGVNPGDKVFFRRHEGWPIEVDWKKFLVLRDRWVEYVEYAEVGNVD